MIDAKHPLYEQNIDKWTKCRDAYDGEDAVKAAGSKYLPLVDPGQNGQEYTAYKMRASYFEAVGRTVDGFVGAISRKPHVIELPAKLGVFTKDATADGLSLDEVIKRLCAETMLTSRCGVLVDYDDKLSRPYFSIYLAESIINWSDDQVVLSEEVYEVDPDDAYGQKAVKQLRQLHVVDGAYTVTLWRQTKNDVGPAEWRVYDEVRPTKRASTLTEMPFFWLSNMGQTSRIEKPPLLGLVNISFSHYRTSADLEHGRHFAGLPTLYVTGISGETPIRVGAASAILLQDPQSKVGYAEFTGQGLKALENALETKEMQMAHLGAAIFGSGRKGIEAAETARIRTSGENSLLMSAVVAVEGVLESALEYAAKWIGASGTLGITLNRDFVDVSLDAQTLTGLVAAYQAGAMTLESFLYCLQQAEFLPPETVLADEVTALEAQATKKAKDEAAIAAAAKPTLQQQPVAA